MNTTNLAARTICPVLLGLAALSWGCIGTPGGARGDSDDPDAKLADAVLEDVTPPDVELLSPEPGAVLTEPGAVVLEAEASDESGVDRVVFFDGDIRLGAADSEPYQFEWLVSEADNGEHELFARAFDAPGNSATSEIVPITVAIQSGGLVQTKWYPGHYSKTQGSCGAGFTGFRVNTSWRMLEPQEGVYDFSMIESALNQAQNQGKKVMLFFQVLDYGSSTTGSAPQWAANKGASYAGHFGDGRQFGVVKVWEPWVTTYYIKLWEALRTRFDSHPALAMVAIGESLMAPAPAPGYTPEKMRDQWFRWCDHFAKWVHTPKVFTMTFGNTKYAKQMSQYAVNHRIGIRDPDQTRQPAAGCGVHPEGLPWIHAWRDYRGQAIYQEMVSQQSSACLPSVQAAFNHAIENGIHYLDWVDAPKNWSAATQRAFIQSKANLPAGGLLAGRPSQWPEYVETTE